MEKINEYMALAQKQSMPFAELNAKDILEAIAYAGRNNDIDNMRITISDDTIRNHTILDMSYEMDEDTLEEYIEVDGPNKSHYSIPIMRNDLSDFNSKELDNRLNQFKREYGKVDMYIDNQYMRDLEIERLNETPIVEEKIKVEEREPELAFASGKEEPNILQINHKRTKLEETEIPVDIKDIASRLENKGYLVRVKPGGHLLVQDQNLAPQNSITITRKNAYIEDANIQSTHAIELYNEMKKEVLQSVDDSFLAMKEKNLAYENSSELANISILQITKDLINEHQDNEVNLNSVFEDSKLKYQFLDDKGKEFISLSLDYSVADDANKSVNPILSVKYGEEYGDFKKTFPITESDIEALNNDVFYKTKLAKEVDDFVKIGKQDRTSSFAVLKANQVKKMLDKDISKDFKFLNHEKIDYFSKVALDYYRDKPDCSLAEYQIQKLKEAPFYRTGMSNDKILNTLRTSFNQIEKKIEDPGLDQIKKNELKFNNFSCRVYENGNLTMDTKAKDPVTYDREWITKLARLEDSLLELRYGPVQDTLNIASSFIRGTKEFTEGILEYKSDGIYSGFDIGRGIGSFMEGWKYGAFVSEMEKDYKILSASENEADRIAAIDKKVDLKLLMEDIHDNTNIYTKAAIELRKSCEGMLDTIRGLKECKEKNTLHDSKLQSYKKQFASLSKKFVKAYNQVKSSLSRVNDNIKTFINHQKTKGIDILNYTEAKAKAVLNSTKDMFNDISKTAQVMLDMKAFTNERIAEQLNDISVIKTFESLPLEEFGINREDTLNNVLAKRFWKELDNTIRDGEEAEKIPVNEQTKEDKDAILLGKMMKSQKEDKTSVAEKIHDKLKECYKENLPYTDVIEQLSKTYNNETMAYRIRNMENPYIRTYDQISADEKQEIQDIIKEFLHTVPSIEERFLDNERALNEERENEPERLTHDENENMDKDENINRNDDEDRG